MVHPGRRDAPAAWAGSLGTAGRERQGRAQSADVAAAISGTLPAPVVTFDVSALVDNLKITASEAEAPDEASHEGRADAKVEALERIDSDIVGPIRKALPELGGGRILISPDHATLIRTRAHDRGHRSAPRL